MAAEDASKTGAAAATMETDKPAQEAGAAEEEEPKPIPDMELAQKVYLLELAQSKPEFVPDAAEVKAQVLAQVGRPAGRQAGRRAAGLDCCGVLMQRQNGETDRSIDRINRLSSTHIT